MATLETNIRQTNADFQAIKNKIEEAGVNVGNAPTSGYADKVSEVYEAGVKSEYDRFWDNYQDNGERQNYAYGFSGSGWNDETFKPKYNIICNGNNENLFSNSRVVDLKGCLEKQGIKLDTKLATSLYLSFYYCRSMTRVPEVDASSATNIGYLLSYSPTIISIDKLILKEDGTQEFDYTLRGLTALRDIVIEGKIGNNLKINSNTHLTKESIISFINALSNTTSGKTLTLSQVAVDNAFMELDLAEDGTINNYIPGSQSAEWEALTDTKTNWTINLV